MAEKTYINVYPEIRLQVEGQVVTAQFNEAFKFWSYFIMAKEGLLCFSSEKAHKIGEKASFVLTSKQYKMFEAK